MKATTIVILMLFLAGLAGCAGVPEGLVKGEVVRVIDGDTAVIRAALPGEEAAEHHVRLIGVDTPEIGMRAEPYAEEAAAYTRRLIDRRTVYLELDVGRRDKYGRVLAYVWLEPAVTNPAENMLNARLLAGGYARLMTVPPNVKYVDLFVELQKQAREAGRGAWGESR